MDCKRIGMPIMRIGLIISTSFLVSCITPQPTQAPIESVDGNTINPPTVDTTSQSASFPLPAQPTIESSQTITLGQTAPNPINEVQSSNSPIDPLSTTQIQQAGSHTIAANSPITINATLNQTANSDSLNSNSVNINTATFPTNDNNLATSNVNWQRITDKVITQVLLEGNTNFASTEVLFVNNVSNQAVSAMPVYVIDQLLNQRAAAIPNAVVAEPQAVLTAKQQLGISPNDTLLTRSKAIAIARQLNARYTLYPIVTGSAETPVLTVQMINASTAEIIAEANSK